MDFLIISLKSSKSSAQKTVEWDIYHESCFCRVVPKYCDPNDEEDHTDVKDLCKPQRHKTFKTHPDHNAKTENQCLKRNKVHHMNHIMESWVK